MLSTAAAARQVDFDDDLAAAARVLVELAVEEGADLGFVTGERGGARGTVRRSQEGCGRFVIPIIFPRVRQWDAL